MSYQQYNNIRPNTFRQEPIDMNGEYNSRGFMNQNKNTFQYSNNNSYDYYSQKYHNDSISRGGFDIKPDSSIHSLKTCTSSGSFGIVKGDSPDFKCYECSKPLSQPEKVPFSFKNLQGIDSIQPFMPKSLEKRNGFTMFNSQNEGNKSIESSNEISCSKMIEEVKVNEREQYQEELFNGSSYGNENVKYNIISPTISISPSSYQKSENYSNIKYCNDFSPKVLSQEINSPPVDSNFKTTYEDVKNASVEFKHEEAKNETITSNSINVLSKILKEEIKGMHSFNEEKLETTNNIQETKNEPLLTLGQEKVDTIQASLNKNNNEEIIDISNAKSTASNYLENKNNIIDENDFVRTHITTESYEILKSWEQINCDKETIKKVIEIGYESPEEIMSIAIPAICNNRDLIFEVNNDSSKYISFLLPIIDNIIKSDYENEANQPIALILTPSKELVLKISKIIESLIKGTPITFAKCYGQYPFRQNLDELKKGCNILTSTPGRLIHFLKSNDISLQNIKYFIIDDIDKMLECGFDEIIGNIINDFDCQKKEYRVNIVSVNKFSPTINDLLCMIIKDTYTMILKNTTNDLLKYKVKYMEGKINISKLPEMLMKHIYEMKKNKNSGGVSLYVDLPTNNKNYISF
uniref:ATP-dependent RNA helicase n=1 Tax=Strongyloides stercoralis TaxID=6248 RepID=A0AAF5DDP8_STRER